MSTKSQVGIWGGSIAALLGLLTALVVLADNHWQGGFGGGDAPSAHTTEGSGRSPRPSPRTPGTAVDADIYLSRDSVPVDGTLTVSGEGFAADETVVITIGVEEVARTQANGEGGFSNVSIAIPEFYRPFQKPMTVPVSAESKPSFMYRASRDLTLT